MGRLFTIGWPYLLVVLHSVGFSVIAMSQVGLPEALDEAAGRSSPRVAITFDDLPWNGPGYTDAEMIGLTDTLLATLTSRGVPATGLVTCRGIQEGAPILRKWLDAGMELGNHSTSHRDLNRTPTDEWLADVEACGEAVSEIAGGPLRWFRYPMLHQGADRQVRDSVARTLETWGYANAHVTIDNSEWLLARAYDLAMQAGDETEAEAVVEAYLAHLREAAAHFRSAGREKFGREVDHVLLLHANAIAARHIGDVLDGLEEDGFTIASLEEVLSDPIYARVDEYVGPVGLSWIYRAAPLSPDDPWDDIAEAALGDRFRWR
ncbi:MAG: polysaccharide deacetylase family protein [Gemmatimonadetes bacterium]|nr:polysaccharide deacetylase family protein [Gemmatimonadota bacterium]